MVLRQVPLSFVQDHVKSGSLILLEVCIERITEEM